MEANCESTIPPEITNGNKYNIQMLVRTPSTVLHPGIHSNWVFHVNLCWSKNGEIAFTYQNNVLLQLRGSLANLRSLCMVAHPLSLSLSLLKKTLCFSYERPGKRHTHMHRLTHIKPHHFCCHGNSCAVSLSPRVNGLPGRRVLSVSLERQSQSWCLKRVAYATLLCRITGCGQRGTQMLSYDWREILSSWL